MTNREKVIKGLEICTKDIPMSNAVHKSDFCKECPYYNAENHYCWNQIVMMRDALALLKEKDPIEPIELIDDFYPIGDPLRTIGWKCSKCMGRLGGLENYCPNCGCEVKWE